MYVCMHMFSIHISLLTHTYIHRHTHTHIHTQMTTHRVWAASSRHAHWQPHCPHIHTQKERKKHTHRLHTECGQQAPGTRIGNLTDTYAYTHTHIDDNLQNVGSKLPARALATSLTDLCGQQRGSTVSKCSLKDARTGSSVVPFGSASLYDDDVDTRLSLSFWARARMSDRDAAR
jgi:hypothetical protein